MRYFVDMKEERSFLVFNHWKKGLKLDKWGFTKRNILSAIATCWSPLNEVGPILTSGKPSISNLRKLQRFLAERLKVAKENLHTRKKFNPLANQGDRQEGGLNIK